MVSNVSYLDTLFTAIGLCCPFVHKWLTDISERKGRENSIKIKKITLQRECKQLLQEKEIHILDSKWLTDVLVPKWSCDHVSKHRSTISCPIDVRNFCCVVWLLANLEGNGL